MSSERSNLGELPQFHELRPTQSVVDALRGTVSLIPFKRKIPGQEEKQPMSAILAVEGPGMIGLVDWKDNRTWSGIFNHSVLSARYSVYLAEQLAKKGFTVNPQRVLDGMIVSHSGRRQWEEAGKYPEAVEDAESKRGKGKSNEALGLRLIQGKVSDEVFELVAALAHENREFPVSEEVKESLEYRITEYVDHRTTGEYLPLSERMGGFLLGYFFKKDEVTQELKESVGSFVEKIINDQKNYRLGKSPEGVSLKQVDQEAASLGASEDSTRLKRVDLLRLIIQDADTEALLEHLGINPNGLNDKTAPMPKWETDLRKEYVRSAKQSIRQAIDSGELKIDFNNPKDWWEEFAIKVVGS